MPKVDKKFWDEWYSIKCPRCDSRDVKECNSYKYTFNKKTKEVQRYICNECGLEFWE